MAEDETTAASEDEAGLAEEAIEHAAQSADDAEDEVAITSDGDDDEEADESPESAFIADDEHSEQAVEAPTFLQWLYARLTRKKPGAIKDLERRLQTLHGSIERHPDAATNYVLRGELYLELGEYELAYEDFSRGLELATAQFERDDWGIVSQAMRDRAEVGLKNTIKHLRRMNKPHESDEQSG